MSARLFEVIAPDEETAIIREIARNHGADDVIVGAPTGDGRRVIRIAVGAADRQALLDSLQMALSGDDKWRIIILPVEATLPRVREDREADEAGEKTGPSSAKRKILSGMTREELSAQLSGGAELDGNFLLLVALSVVVAAIGLVQNNVAVVIGAMVIAPLLGPNLALAFGGAVGAKSLMIQAMRTNLAGIGFTLLLSVGIGWLVGPEASSEELMARTRVDLAGVALALASGAAAALSLTNGLSSTLVGVMVAVALLPPATAIGIMLGSARWDLALGAALLLAVNVVSVNLSAQAVFRLKGIRPRTWFDDGRSGGFAWMTIAFWTCLLIALMVVTVRMNGG